MSDKKFFYPWENTTFSQRLSALHIKNKKKIVYICSAGPADLYSSFRYRIFNMCEILNKSTEYTAIYFFEKELERLSKYIDYIDHIIIERVLWSITINEFIIFAKSKNLHIYFDIDDYIYDIKILPLIINTISIFEPDKTDFDNYFLYASKLFLTTSLCDSYITTNEFLAEKLRASFQKPVFVVPNFLNDQQMLVSSQLWETKKINFDLQYRKENPQKKILIGYFSGTSSHNKDFGSIADELCALMKENPQVHLRLVGHLELPPSLQEFRAAGRIEYLPLQNYVALQKYIAECDINLIPLVINDFTHCKSEIKYFEAAVVGTLSVASPTFIYKQVIQHGKNGFLSAQGKWKETLEYMIKNFHHLLPVIESARKHAVENYYGSRVLNKLEQVFGKTSS